MQLCNFNPYIVCGKHEADKKIKGYKLCSWSAVLGQNNIHTVIRSPYEVSQYNSNELLFTAISTFLLVSMHFLKVVVNE